RGRKHFERTQCHVAQVSDRRCDNMKPGRERWRLDGLALQKVAPGGGATVPAGIGCLFPRLHADYLRAIFADRRPRGWRSPGGNAVHSHALVITISLRQTVHHDRMCWKSLFFPVTLPIAGMCLLDVNGVAATFCSRVPGERS